MDVYKLATPRSLLGGPAYVARILTPRSRKSGYGLLLGYRSGLIDSGVRGADELPIAIAWRMTTASSHLRQRETTRQRRGPTTTSARESVKRASQET